MKRCVGLIFFTVFCIAIAGRADAKKIKNSFKIEKESKVNDVAAPKIEGLRLEGEEVSEYVFSGYDKEASSSTESFILSNPKNVTVTGFKVKIEYLDMKGRMLHSRVVEEPCYIPGGESRRLDIKSWDIQKVYYYYLGNEPRRVATPFQVKFHPLYVWVLEED